MVFGFLRRGGKDWIERVSIEELEKEMIKVETRANMVAREIERLQAERERLFEYGKGKPEAEKLMLAEKIKDIDAEIAAKQEEYQRLLRQRQALSNLARLKRWEAQLKQKGIWERLKSVDPEKLIDMLADMKFDAREFDKAIDAINAALGPQAGGFAADSKTKEILKKWKEAEEGGS
ncbi:MAG: hypothetical protein LRS49_06095 [Desulfurococcales archaeon]|nr:hypothetical protein [Desulfurococcales archaeon]